MTDLECEYRNLLRNQCFNEEFIDYDILEKQIAVLSQSAVLSGTALSIFDIYKQTHVYESPFHKELFKDIDGNYKGFKIHPDDCEQALVNGIATLRHLFMNNKNARFIKLIREYRALVNGTYKRITEQMQILEIDKIGNIWLALSIINISPNQSPPYKVNSKIVNTQTGDIFSPVDRFFNENKILSEREIEILKLINKGLLSKEISFLLNISVHTVNTHRQRILEKLDVKNSIEAIKYAQNLGLIDD